MTLKLNTGRAVPCDKIINVEIAPVDFYETLSFAREDSRNGHCDYGRHYLHALTLAIGLENTTIFEVFIEYYINGKHETVFDICHEPICIEEYLEEHVYDRVNGIIYIETEYEI